MNDDPKLQKSSAMHRQTIFFLSFMLLIITVRAQKFELAASIGMGTYSMKDLKQINKNALEILPFEAQITNEFPPWIQYRASVVYNLHDKYKFGIVYIHNSTGSRISSKDYSGEYSFDNLLTGNSAGILLGMNLFRMQRFTIDLDAIFGGIFTRFVNKEQLAVADTVISATSTFNSTSFFCNPELEFTYSFPVVNAGAFFGYMLDAGGKSTWSNWSGMRLGVFVAMRFPYTIETKGKKEEDK